jgi:hypothetical protein
MEKKNQWGPQIPDRPCNPACGRVTTPRGLPCRRGSNAPPRQRNVKDWSDLYYCRAARGRSFQWILCSCRICVRVERGRRIDNASGAVRSGCAHDPAHAEPAHTSQPNCAKRRAARATETACTGKPAEAMRRPGRSSSAPALLAGLLRIVARQAFLEPDNCRWHIAPRRGKSLHDRRPSA